MRLPWRGADLSTVADIYPLYFIAFTVQLGMGIVAPILPEIMRDFVLSAWQVGMVVTVFGLARLVTDLPLGLLMERVDRTKILLFGALLIVAGSIASGLASDYGFLLAARLAMGIGSALCTVTALFSLSRASGEKSRGSVIGIYQAAMVGGTTFSPVIGGVAASLAGWRASFFFCAFTGVVALLLVVTASRGGKLRFSSASARKRGLEGPPPAQRDGWHVPWNLVSINLTTFAFFFSVAGFRNSMVPIYGGTELGIGAGTLGLLLGGSAVLRFLVTLGSGFASDRYGRKIILIPGTLFLAAGTLGFPMARELPAFALCLVILSFGGFGNSIPTTMVVDAVPARQVGLAISVNRFIGDAGLLVGPVVLGWVLDTMGFPAVAAVTAGLLLGTVPGVALAVHEKRPPRQPVAGGTEGAR